MKILSEEPDLKRKFRIEMTLEELKVIGDMLNDHWCRYDIFPQSTPQYRFYQEIRKLLNKKI